MEELSTKQLIALEARKLFLEYGYEKTSMRQIASACDLSLGNVSYHYKKKEHILMDLHRNTTRKFYNEVSEFTVEENDPLIKFFSTHIAYLFRVINNPILTEIYLSLAKYFFAKEDYIKIHNELFLDFFDSSGYDKRDIFMITTTCCSSEFDLIYHFTNHSSEVDFEYVISFPLKSRMLLLGIPPKYIDDMFNQSLELGKYLYSKLDRDFY